MQSSFTIHFQLIVSRKVVVMESGEIIHEKVYVSPRPPPTISYKDNSTCNLDSEVAGSSKDNPTNRTKTQYPIVKFGKDLLQNGVKKKPWNVPRLIATLLIKRNMIMSQIQRVR